MNDIHQNSSLQSFRKTVQANWTDMRRTVFVEAVQSGGNIHFKYNYKNMTYKIISDNWIYKLKRCGKELGYSQEEIDDAVYCFPGEISCELSLNQELIDFLGTKAPEEPGYFSEKILKSLIHEIERQLIKKANNIIPFPQKQEKAK